MSNLVEILVTAKDLAGPALAKAQADAARFQAEAARQSAAASAAAGRRQQLEMERERLYAAERSSIARRSAGETTAAQRAAEQEQIALARRANSQQITAAREVEREQVASARRASAQVAAAQREQLAATKASAGKMRTAIEGIALGSAVVGVESIKMASKFDASMALLVTQAGVAKSQMGTLKQGVLDLAGKVGQDPDSLAESLFHVESNFESLGISSAKALKLTETAAKGATVGHANLVDVTNALTAAVAAGVPGVKNFDQAMGVLNATVGVGDMKMQDLANAFSTGMLATVKGFGLSIQDVGASLAVFGDNNIRGSIAGNQLRMSVMALAKPVSTAGATLKELGLTTKTLSTDMQKGGLKLALEDLIDRMHKAGISSKEQGKVITDAFGRKAGSGLNILVDQFDRLESKYPKLNEGAHKFGQSWEDTKKTFQFQMNAMKSELDSLMIKIGIKLIPVAEKFLKFLTDVSKSGDVKDVLKTIGDEGSAAFDMLGAGLKIAAPFLKEVIAGFQAALEYFTPFISEIGRVGSAIADALFPAKDASKGLDGPFTRALAMIRENKGAIEEAARGFGNALISMSEVAIQNLPVVTKLLRTLSTVALVTLGSIVDGAAKAFGWMPGIGGKLKSAAKGFDDFRDSVMQGMAKADQATSGFAARALPRLEQARLKLNISDWEAQIKTAKAQLDKGVPAAKAAYLKAHIEDLQANVANAKKSLDSIDHRAAVAKVEANVAPFFGNLAKVRGAQIPTKSARIVANAGGFWGAVSSIAGRVLGTSYIDVQMRKVESQMAPAFKADGGVIEGGSGMKDDVPLMAMGGEYIVNKKSTAKHLALLQAINEDKLPGFAKGGLTSGETDARKQINSSFGISYFGRLAGYHRTPFEHDLAVPTDINALVQSLNGVAGEIRSAFRGRTETHLLKELNSVGKSLISYDQKLGAVNSSLDAARTKLDGLKQSASQLSDSVKSGVLSSSAITQGVSANSTVTVADLMGSLTQSRDKATAFSGALKGLKAKGLSSALIQQIGEAGVNGGGLETAGALLGASSSEISSINRLQGQITQAAGAAGATTADAVYGSAIKAQNKLVSSLEGQQARLEKAMDRLAAVMQAALQRALKGKAAGGIVGAAASGGLRGGLTWVGEYEPELLDLPVGARVHSGPDSRRMAAAAAGHGGPMVLEIRSSGSEIDELFLKVFRRIVRVRGGNVQMVLAGRPA